MDPGCLKFGKGPTELTGGRDLISYAKLLPHLETFCKKTRPASVLDTHYLNNVIGDKEIRKGEGMQLDQLVRNEFFRDTKARIQPFNLGVLREAFHLRETSSIDLPPSDKGIPTVAGKSKRESKHKDKHKKHKDKNREKDGHKKHKHHKDRSKDKKKEKKKHNEKEKKRDRIENTNAIQAHKYLKV